MKKNIMVNFEKKWLIKNINKKFIKIFFQKKIIDGKYND